MTSGESQSTLLILGSSFCRSEVPSKCQGSHTEKFPTPVRNLETRSNEFLSHSLIDDDLDKNAGLYEVGSDDQ